MRLKVLRASDLKPTAKPHLVALSEGPNIPLEKPIILIGRHQECDIQIPSRKISRRHCCIAQVDAHLVIRDLGSTNGIRINGVKVVEGNLQSNDEVIIGNMRYQVSWGANPVVAGPKNGIKVGEPPVRKMRSSDDSFEAPTPLSDAAQSNVQKLGVPPGGMPLPSQEIDDNSDDIRLVPIDPPKP